MLFRSIISFSSAVLLPWLLLLQSTTIANAESGYRQTTVVVSPKARVKSAKITLGGIANIQQGEPEFAELANRLRELEIADAPPPSGSVNIVGESILNKIKESGIDIESFGYSIPKVVEVERAGHVISADEVLQVVRQKLHEDKTLDLQVREVSWRNTQVIPEGTERVLSIQPLGVPSAGKLPLRVEASVDGEHVARFLATAVVDDWREVPVLSRALERGQLISPTDIQIVRLNLYKQPADIVDDVTEVFGRRAKAGMAAGETIRRSQIDLPPVVAKGQKVSIVYNNGPLYATATGVAMEDGQKKQIITVRNEQSKKVVTAEIVSEDEVKVVGN